MDEIFGFSMRGGGSFLTSDQKQIVKTWIAAGLWMILIAIEGSSDAFSAEKTSRILYPIFHFLMGLDLVHFEVWHRYLETGHFVGYFTLSFFLFRAWRATLHLPWAPRWTMRWATIAFFMSALVASLDEWHQSFLPSRTGVFRDVVLDSCGALTAQVLIFLFSTWRPRQMRAAGD